MDMIKIGKFIAELRKENGYTQEQLAEKLGVTGKTVSRWETGTYLPPIEKLQQISILYSVSMNDILNGEQIGSEEYPQKADENLVAVIENEKRASHRTVRCPFYQRFTFDYIFDVLPLKGCQ